MKFVQHKDVAWNHLGEEIIAFNLSGDKQFHNLNCSAAFLFEALGSAHTSQELVSKLTEEFDVPETQAAHDVEALLEELKNKGLITEA